MLRIPPVALSLTFGLGIASLCLGQGPAVPSAPPAPANRTTSITCGLYAQASTQSAMLSIVGAGSQIQVLDSSNAHFIRAQVSKDGKVLTGYMYRACLGGAR